MPLNLAIFGTGYIAGYHATAVSKLPNVRLVAVVNPGLQKMAEFAERFGVKRQYTHLGELFKDGGIDGLIICSPNYSHLPAGIAALEAGWHLLVEKPMAMNALEALQMVETSEERGDVDDTGVMLVNWDNGVTTYIESGWWQPKADGPEASTNIYGTCGFGSIFPTRLIFPGEKPEDQNIQEAGFAFPRKDHAPQAMYDRQMFHFVDCIRNQRAPLASGLVGWTNMRIIDAAYQSSDTGEVVKL